MEANWIDGPPTEAGYYWAWSGLEIRIVEVFFWPMNDLSCMCLSDNRPGPRNWILKHMKIKFPPAP